MNTWPAQARATPTPSLLCLVSVHPRNGEGERVCPCVSWCLLRVPLTCIVRVFAFLIGGGKLECRPLTQAPTDASTSLCLHARARVQVHVCVSADLLSVRLPRLTFMLGNRRKHRSYFLWSPRKQTRGRSEGCRGRGYAEGAREVSYRKMGDGGGAVHEAQNTTRLLRTHTHTSTQQSGGDKPRQQQTVGERSVGNIYVRRQSRRDARAAYSSRLVPTSDRFSLQRKMKHASQLLCHSIFSAGENHLQLLVLRNQLWVRIAHDTPFAD